MTAAPAVCAPGLAQPVPAFPPTAGGHRILARRDHALTTWFFGVLVVLLGGVFPTIVIAGTHRDTSRLTWLAALVVCVWAAFRLSAVIALGRPQLFEFSFWTYVYLYLGVAPLAQLRTETFPTTSPVVDQDLVVQTWVAIIGGIAAWETGRALAPRFRAFRSSTATRAMPTSLSERRAVALTVVSIGFGLMYMAIVGPALLSSREDAVDALAAKLGDPSIGAIVLALGFAPLLISVHAMVRISRMQRRQFGRTYSILIAVAFVVLFLDVNPVSGSRYAFGTLGLSVIALFGGFATKARCRAFMLGTLFVFVFLFPALAVSRYSADDQPMVQQHASFLSNIQTSGDYDSFSQINTALSFVRANGNTHGRQILGSVCFWTPRSLWPNKPIDTGIQLADYRGYWFKNLSAPLWAEAFVNGGWIVLFVVFLLAGAATRRWSEQTARGLTANRPGAILGSIFAFYSLILLRGSLLQATGAAVLMVVCARVVTVHGAPPSGPVRPTGRTVRFGHRRRSRVLDPATPEPVRVTAAELLRR